MDEAERVFREGFRELVGRAPAVEPVDLAEVIERGGTSGDHPRRPLRRWLAAAAVIAIVAGVGVGMWSRLGRSAILPAVPAGAPHTGAAGLVGPTWLATSIGGRDVIATAEGDVPFLVFADDGEVTGGDPCNGMRGTYRLVGRKLAISELMATEMGCGERDVVLQQGRFADVLRATLEARRSGDTLEFVDASGTVVVTFTAQMTRPTPTSSPVSPITATPTTRPPDSPVANTVEVRIRNDSTVTFDSVEIWLRRLPPLGPGASSEYLTPPGDAYRYARVAVTVGGREIVLQPVDFVGETPLEPGRYTYALSVTGGGDLALEFETDE